MVVLFISFFVVGTGQFIACEVKFTLADKDQVVRRPLFRHQHFRVVCRCLPHRLHFAWSKQTSYIYMCVQSRVNDTVNETLVALF